MESTCLPYLRDPGDESGRSDSTPYRERNWKRNPLSDPVHLQGAYRNLGYGRGSFPKAEQCAEEFVSLPMFPELTTKQVDYVIETLKEALCENDGTGKFTARTFWRHFRDKEPYRSRLCGANATRKGKQGNAMIWKSKLSTLARPLVGSGSIVSFGQYRVSQQCVGKCTCETYRHRPHYCRVTLFWKSARSSAAHGFTEPF